LPPAGDDEYYWRDLEGLEVWCSAESGDVLLGQVDHLLETGANDVMVVRATASSLDDRERLIPWLPGDVVSRVDLQAGCLWVQWHLDD
jgi:16S rRNA processing protein RimM